MDNVDAKDFITLITSETMDNTKPVVAHGTFHKKYGFIRLSLNGSNLDFPSNWSVFNQLNENLEASLSLFNDKDELLKLLSKFFGFEIFRLSLKLQNSVVVFEFNSVDEVDLASAA